MKVVAKQAAIDEAKKNYGYFALISNEIKDPIEALDIYRNKDMVEKAFGNLKERLSLRRMSYIKKAMKENDLFGTYTMQGVLDQLDGIECFGRPGRELRIGEITSQQKELFLKLEIAPPTSLWVGGNAGCTIAKCIWTYISNI